MNKTPAAVVTGASTGLGLELSVQLADHGYFVVGISRSGIADDRWRYLETQGRVKWVRGDVSDPTTVDNAIRTAVEAGPYGLLVNCAGRGVFGAAGAYSAEDITEVLAGNLVGMMLFCSTSLKVFSDSGGTIVNVMSTAARVGRANETIYCAAKWGARGYTEALRVELKDKPVRIIAVYPGGMKTPFWNRAKGRKVDPAQFMAAHEVAHEIVAAIAAKQSLQVSELVLNRI